MAGLHLPDGTMLYHYEVLAMIGAGGFGITYKARDHETGEVVAIKEFFPRTAAMRDDDGSVYYSHSNVEAAFRKGLDQFVKEARTLALFHHPNIVRVRQIFAANGTGYFVQDYIDGGSLENWAQRAERLPRQDELDGFCEAFLDALETVHMNDYLHRDLAPKNVLLNAIGQPVLIDFGSARQFVGSATMTAMVTPNYAAYEQYLTSGQGQGPWTDIYGAAATLYRLIAGKPPADAPGRSLDATSYTPVREIGRSHYRSAFLDAIDWGLEVHPQERPQSIGEWRSALCDRSGPPSAVGLNTLMRSNPPPMLDRLRDMLQGRRKP